MFDKDFDIKLYLRITLITLPLATTILGLLVYLHNIVHFNFGVSLIDSIARHKVIHFVVFVLLLLLMFVQWLYFKQRYKRLRNDRVLF